MNEDLKILDDFIINNKDLEKLESLISEFNFFEAIGSVRQELRHSDFLAFLLKPNSINGIGDVFIKKLLKHLIHKSQSSNLTAVDFDVLDYSDVSVERELKNIDILIKVPSLNFYCVIENKIYSGEGKNQLKTYESTMNKEFPNSEKLFVYLTPEGLEPSSHNWIILSYSEISRILSTALNAKKSLLGTDLETIMRHYLTMLDHHIIPDSKVAELCKKIYNNHKAALNLIYEHKPDILLDINGFLRKIISNDTKNNLVLDHCSKQYVRFAPKPWDEMSFQSKGEGWTKSGRILLFEFRNYENKLSLNLVIGPGDNEMREDLYNKIMQAANLSVNKSRNLTDKWFAAYTKNILSSEDYEKNQETIEEKIQSSWDKFIKYDFIKLKDLIG